MLGKMCSWDQFNNKCDAVCEYMENDLISLSFFCSTSDYFDGRNFRSFVVFDQIRKMFCNWPIRKSFSPLRNLLKLRFSSLSVCELWIHTFLTDLWVLLPYKERNWISSFVFGGRWSVLNSVDTIRVSWYKSHTDDITNMGVFTYWMARRDRLDTITLHNALHCLEVDCKNHIIGLLDPRGR